MAFESRMTLNGSEFADALSAQEIGKIVGRAAVLEVLVALSGRTWTIKCIENIGNVGFCACGRVDGPE
jgi:hypothetical protein